MAKKEDAKYKKDFKLTDQQRNELQPGSYIIKDGELQPNMNDEAMKKRDTAAAAEHAAHQHVE